MRGSSKLISLKFAIILILLVVDVILKVVSMLKLGGLLIVISIKVEEFDELDVYVVGFGLLVH